MDNDQIKIGEQGSICCGLSTLEEALKPNVLLAHTYEGQPLQV